VQEELLLSGLTRRAAAADIVVMLVFLAVLAEACAAWDAAYRASHPLSTDMLRSWLLPVATGDLLALALALWLTRQGRLKGSALGLRPEGLTGQVVWGMAGAGLGLLASALWTGVRVALVIVVHPAEADSGWWWYTGEGPAEAVRGVSVGTLLAVMGVIVLGEEVAFRGIILPRLRRITGRWWSAVLLCSLIFGLFHWSAGFGRVGTTALVSVAFCIVFIRSRSLLAAGVAHFLYNMTLYGVGNMLSAG
jgi:membrane protease YdiL (CAAX protease family)